MAYTINKYSGEPLIVLQDGTIDTSTSLNLVGRNYVGYGESQNENFVFLLENFANDAPPTRPIRGQIWFNTSENSAYIYDGANWVLIGSAILSELAPANPTIGALWLKTPVNSLSVWNGTSWSFIGPESVPGFGVTRFRSSVIKDTDDTDRPVIFLEINDIIFGVCTATPFVINPNNAIANISNTLVAGINLAEGFVINGNVTGSAGTVNRFTTPRLINGVAFDGQQNITIKSSTTQKLIKGSFLSGSDFDGSQEVTLNVDATSANIIGKVVSRNSEGGFAAGTITADLVGNVTGDVTSTGESNFNIIRANQFIGAVLTGNAFSATQLAVPKKINGVDFNGTTDITITASAGTLTGNTLNSTVTISSLTQVGTLASLNVSDPGVSVGSANQIRLFVDAGISTLRSTTGRLNLDIGESGPDVSFINATSSLGLGGPSAPAIIGDNTTNLGIPGYKFNNIYANNFLGNATTATTAGTATNIAGGSQGALVYQTGNGSTGFINIGADGYVLRARPGNTLQWEPLSFEQLNKGSFLNFVNTVSSNPVEFFNSSSPVTISVDATSTNTASKIVARDSNGNFSAGTITANLTGSVSGNATTATRLQTARNINGVAFDGTVDITVPGVDNTRVLKSGDTMTGFLTLNANPISNLHATTKQYVDSRLPQYTFVAGNTIYSTSSFTNQVGSWNDGANHFDVFPPAGKTMSDLIAFIPSIAVIHYAGGVNGDDSMRCTWSNLGDRIRVYVQNTEQRSTPAANYLAIWS